MRKLLSLLLVLGTTTPVHAAENLDRAVASIAQQFVESRKPDAAPLRVAVTAFVASDRRTTQFTNFLMSALTGEMIAQSEGKFRVIERQQLEAALSEIEMQPIFSPDSAKDLGNFLGVDALIIGETTPLADTVRLNARLIMVDTVETIAQAREWVPLTPTVANQLAEEVRLSRIRVGGEGADRRAGIWSGTGTCGDSRFGVALSILVNPDETVTAMQSYYPNSQRAKLESGVLEMEGRFDPQTGKLTLAPLNWLYQPAGHAASGFVGTMDVERGLFDGTYTTEGCQSISLRRVSP